MNGTLKDYLAENQNKITIEFQEDLYRFVIDVAKGIEYLASKGVCGNTQLLKAEV